MGKVRLNVLGLSYSQSQAGAYALVLTEETGNRRLPIIIGAAEAQSIAIKLENLRPFRPLTHDLFLNFADEYSVRITEVVIYKLEEGIFYSELHCISGQKKTVIDSRTSDAVALALRFDCPIYVVDEIIDKAGIVIDEETQASEADEQMTENVAHQAALDLSEKTKVELEKMLDDAISSENYEEASQIRDELNNR